MTNTASILAGQTGSYSCLKVNGRGDVFVSPKVKCYTDQFVENKETSFGIDLTNCTYMDSTFMGMLAGLAIKLRQKNHYTLPLFGVNTRNQEALEELGMDSLMEINPVSADWKRSLEDISFQPWDPNMSDRPSGGLLLDCHQNLSRLNEQNEKKFGDVIKTLQK